MRRCIATRPTAINLKWALDEMMAARAQPAARGARRRRLPPRGGDRRRGRRDQPGDRPARPEADRGHRRAQEAGEPVNVLTHCNAGWLATVDWRHRDRADLPGARQGHADPCLGRRDAAAQPGRFAHRLGARPARRAAHRDRRQHRRPSDAARHGRHRRSSAPTASPRRATSATRSAPI